MSQYAYLFQAKGIQRYILEGGKLKDMVAANELVNRLCRSKGVRICRHVDSFHQT